MATSGDFCVATDTRFRKRGGACGGQTPMYVFCQAGAHRAHSLARLLPFAVLAAEVAVRRGALTLEAQDGEALAALLAADTSFFHDLLLFVPARGGGPCPYPPLDPLRVCA